MKKLLVPLAIIAVVMVGLVLYTTRLRDREEKGHLAVSGNIEATTVEVSFKIPGRIKERLVDEGETLRSGQTIALLEDDDLRQEVRLREAERQAAAAQLAELQAGSLREEIGRAEAAAAAAEAEAARLATDFARQQALFNREVISRRDFDAALAARDAAQARLREARENLALVRKGPRRERIDQAAARLREAEAALALADTRHGYATLVAPLAGMVLAKNAEPGEQVTAGTPVVTVANLERVWLRAYIPETDLGRVKLGQKARVTTDTWPGRVYQGLVSFIAGEAEFTPKNVQTQKERVKLVYRIKIDIPNPGQELKPGMPADAEIITEGNRQ